MAAAADPHAEHLAPPADVHAGHGARSSSAGALPTAGSLPPGYVALTLPDDAARRLDLTSAAAGPREFARTVRTVGMVTVDETRSSHVHPRVRGWVDSVQVNFIGQPVRQGAPLCTIYSPEILTAELELLAILNQSKVGTAATQAFADIEQRSREITLESARRRLELWDVPRTEIQRLETSREARKTFPLLAPRSGTVVAKQATAGMYVDASTELYLVSDLSRVWVLVDLYAADVAFVKLGDTAKLTVEGLDTPIESAITFLAPAIDETTRTLKARFELENAGGQLRPGAFVTAQMELTAGEGLAVPEQAVIRTGSRNIVFIVHGNHVEPREISLGPVMGGYYRVTAGLNAGEQVATSAQFLLDSDSRIRATSSPGGAHAH